jgi:hypothetical protein
MAQNKANTDGIEWNSTIEYDDADGEYDRSACGMLVIDGPEGRLVVLKWFRAMVDESKVFMERGKIWEVSTYYRAGENDPFTYGTAELDVPEDALADREAFVEYCLAAIEAMPEVQYALHPPDL